MKKKLLYLSNQANSDPEEDLYLAEALRIDFDIRIVHPLDSEQYLHDTDGVVVRNIWPTYEYLDEWKRIMNMLKKSGIKTYNPLTGKGDLGGKKYLVELYDSGLPVIPSIDSIQKIEKLPKSESYWIKPLESCDGVGAKKCTRQELLETDISDFIIQPYIEFESEPSFYFIDGRFSYAITMPNRILDTNIKQYLPMDDDLLFAQKFVAWNDLPYGIQRIDAVRLFDGTLLLTEVEDIAEYLYLLDLDKNERESVTKTLLNSVRNAFA